MDLATRLKTKHNGEENAVKSPVLEKCYHCSGAEIRKQINELRCNGIPICSTSKGYFYASSVSEAESTIAQLDSRVRRISAARNGIMRGLKGCGLNA